MSWARVLVVAFTTALHVSSFVIATTDPAFGAPRFDESDYLALTGLAPDPLLGAHGALLSPGYRASLLLAYGIGCRALMPLLILNLLYGVGSVVLTFETMRRLLDERWAVGGAVFYAMLGVPLFYEQKLLPDVFVGFGAALLLYLLHPSAVPRSVGRTLALGGAAGWLIAGRATLALMLVPTVFELVRRAARGETRSAAISTGWLAIGLSASLLMVTMLAGRPVAQSGGLNLYIGNGPGATGSFHLPAGWVVNGESPRMMVPAASRAAGLESDSLADVNAHYLSALVSHVLSDPARWVELVAHKAWLAVQRDEAADNHDYGFERRFHPVLRVAPDTLFLMVLGVPGMVLALRSKRRALRQVAYQALLVPLGFVLVFVSGRYRIAWYPMLVILGTYFASRAWIDVEQRRWRHMMLAVVAIVAMGWVTTRHKSTTDVAYQYFLRGIDLHRAGHPDLATGAYETALRIDADDAALRSMVMPNLRLARDEIEEREAHSE